MFSGKMMFCLVNLCVCFEIDLVIMLIDVLKKVVIVGVGFVGMFIVMMVVECGYMVMLFDCDDKVGGQFNVVKQISGKEEFWGFVDWYDVMFKDLGVDIQFGCEVGVNDLVGFDEVVIVIGVILCDPGISGQDYEMVLGYLDVFKYKKFVGKCVVVIGVGGIGFDVLEFFVYDGESFIEDLFVWMKEWGVIDSGEECGGFVFEGFQFYVVVCEVILLQ